MGEADSITAETVYPAEKFWRRAVVDGSVENGRLSRSAVHERAQQHQHRHAATVKAEASPRRATKCHRQPVLR